ncbi:MAG: TonB-dependent receptor, partial [Flavobacteriaceae bacterium]|nr:TonB-dependent receptor [Flavobacteriaceae bacterium]
YEGSNRLGKSKTARWMPTWNISGAWNATQEDFFESLRPALSNFTLKGSYSLTADSGPVSNSLVDLRNVNVWRPTADEKETAIVVRGIENSELTYEKKNELNIGFEAGFINNRINLTFDWYKRNNYDLIGPVYTQGGGGQIVKFGNVASMKSDGVELSISSTNIKTEDFSWTTNFVYSKTNNEITQLESRKRVLDLVSSRGFGMVGYPVRGIFSIPFKGLNADGLPTFLNDKGETTVYDVNLQSRDNIDFLEYSGNVNPTDVGSFGNTFKYKNLTLNVFATYSFGNVLRLDPAFRASYNDFSSLPRELADRWMVSGDENITTVPTIPDVRMIRRYGGSRIGKAFNIYNYSTDRIAKGDFIRLKEVSLNYDFPKQMLKNLKVSRLSMKLQATNLFLLYSDKKLKGQDPEFLNSGGVATPVPRQITLTLNLSI